MMDRNQLSCSICEKRCRLGSGKMDGCGLYEVKDSRIVERFENKYLVACPISIETMPVLHFYPGGKFFQISTTGCNLHCPGCISTVLVREMLPDSGALETLTPDQILNRAVRNGCIGIVFLMNDPLAAFPRFLEIAEIARSEGLLVGCSSNACFTEESLKTLLPWLDFINVGMKGFSDRAYRDCGAPGLQPVLRNLRTLHAAGVHIEVSCIHTRENRAELLELARYIAGISRHIPLQIMRFLPFESTRIDMEPSIAEAEALVPEMRNMLDFVYLFNSPGSRYLHTFCPQCGGTVIKRDFYGPMGAKIIQDENAPHRIDRCPECSASLPISGSSAKVQYLEKDFEGGYPFTRALEMVEAMLIAMDVRSKKVISAAWEDLLQKYGLNTLHISIQKPGAYVAALRYFGNVAGVSDRAEALASYMEDRLTMVAEALRAVERRPRVYYAMGKPLFYLNGGRLENELVEMAGGISVNRDLPGGGRPGRTQTAQQLRRLNPEVIIISAFISNSVKDFHAECLREEFGDVEAVKNRRIYVHPAPGWDFGSPRWILGLMYIASILHPDRCSFDVIAEAEKFYSEFYETDFDPLKVNRSFGKPDCRWRWDE